MSQFSFFDTPLTGLRVVERKPIQDSRGFLARIFCENQMQELGWSNPVAQINQTLTKHKGTVRGLHFQNPPYSEMKLISCLHGEIWDVAVDLRKKSPTYLKWYAEKLSPENNRALLIPEGFAHGFQTLTDNCELLYVHSAPYMRNFEGGVRFSDPTIGIKWPIQCSECSLRDSELPFINNEFDGVEI